LRKDAYGISFDELAREQADAERERRDKPEAEGDRLNEWEEREDLEVP
jgi:hypothetical protein